MQYLFIKPRSLVFLSGEARFIWEHSIPNRKVDKVDDNLYFRKRRVSLSFRKVREGKCNCPFIEYCDGYKKKAGTIQSLSDYNINLENKNNLTNKNDNSNVSFNDPNSK